MGRVQRSLQRWGKGASCTVCRGHHQKVLVLVIHQSLLGISVYGAGLSTLADAKQNIDLNQLQLAVRIRANGFQAHGASALARVGRDKRHER